MNDQIAGLIVTTAYETMYGHWKCNPPVVVRGDGTTTDCLWQTLPAGVCCEMALHESWLRPIRGTPEPAENTTRETDFAHA
jgi:hypothetical protein